jgi:hypothetical protein
LYQELIDQFHSGRHTKLKWARFAALLSCLSAEQTCDFIAAMVRSESDPYVQRAVAAKLKRDLETFGWQPFHERLIADLLQDFDTLQTQNVLASSQALAAMASESATPLPYAKEITSILLMSERFRVREHTYNALTERDVSDLQDVIIEAWQCYKDAACGRLIVTGLPVEVVEKHFDSLWESGSKRLITMLCMVINLTPKRLKALRRYDGITYAYICAKRGICLSDREATKLWEVYKTDDRVKLLLWCFGRMQLRDFLWSLDLTFKRPVEARILTEP